MKTVNCEAVRMASSAASDGYRGPLEPAQIEDHLARCGDCRSEVDRLGELVRLLDSLNRREFDEQVWSGIEARLAAQESVGGASRDLRLLVPVGVVLLAYKLFEQTAARNIGFQIKLVPLLLVIVLFVRLKENPFKISAELKVNE
ncbi:MAG TPA: hypothetical protein VLG74_01685 [Blastocatellia bacterium]|nr:hypothetical protein [Blastocatellia bacterium]